MKPCYAGAAMKPHLRRACEVVVGALPKDDEEVMSAWRTVFRTLVRTERVTSRTLPRMAGLAQHAVFIRDAIDVLIPALPRHMFSVAADLRTHALAIISAMEKDGSSRDAADV